MFYPIAGRQISRQFVVPANPDTTYQQTARTIFSTISSAYTALTPAEKSSWETLAASTTIIDKDGQETTIPTKALFQRINQYRVLHGQAIATTAPTPVAGSIASLPDTVSVDLTLSTGAIAISVAGASSSDGSLYEISITPVLPGTTRVARETDLRLATVTPANSIRPATSASSISWSVGAGAVNLRQSFTAGTHRIGVKIVSLSSVYIPLGEVFNTDTDIDVSA